MKLTAVNGYSSPYINLKQNNNSQPAFGLGGFGNMPYGDGRPSKPLFSAEEKRAIKETAKAATKIFIENDPILKTVSKIFKALK